MLRLRLLSPHSAIAWHTSVSPRVRKMPGATQFFTQGLKVVYLAVEHQCVTLVSSGHRLQAGFDVDHRQAAVAKMGDTLLKITFCVRAAMGQAPVHATEHGA
jgi:hypothetical protein